MTEVSDVREFLNNIVATRLPDETITKQIEIANTTVDSEKGSGATEQQVEDAKLVHAGYLSFNAYAGQLERSLGGTPPEVTRQLEFYKTLSESMMAYVKRGTPVFQPAVSEQKSLEKQYIDGELEGETH